MRNEMNYPMGNNPIDIMELARALWKNILLIALAAVLFGSAAFGYTAFMVSPTYQATVSLYVNNSSFRFGDTSFSVSTGSSSSASSFVSIYLYILRSRTTMEEVIKEAGLSCSPGALMGMISAVAVPETAAFEVTVTSRNPAETELIANTIAHVLPRRIADIVDGSSVRVVDYAIIPAGRSGPNLISNTRMGILAGAFLSAALVIMFNVMNSKNNVMIQSADELREMFPDIMVLAQIPDMRGSEKKGYYSSYYGSTDRKKEGRKNGNR